MVQSVTMSHACLNGDDEVIERIPDQGPVKVNMAPEFMTAVSNAL